MDLSIRDVGDFLFVELSFDKYPLRYKFGKRMLFCGLVGTEMVGANLRRLGSFFIYQKNSGNSGCDVNGTRLFGLFHLKFSGINGISEKVVPGFPGGNFVFHLQIPRLYSFYHQFHTFHGLSRSRPGVPRLPRMELVANGTRSS